MSDPLTRQLSVRLPATLLSQVKLMAVESEITVTEVVTRLLTSYTDGKIVVKKKREEAK